MISLHFQPRFLKPMEELAPRRAVRTARSVARLSLFINGTAYQVHSLPASETAGPTRAFRLRKLDGTVYDILQSGGEIHCDCPDYTFNRDGIDPEGCKHIKALLSCGLLDRTEPQPAGEPVLRLARCPRPARGAGGQDLPSAGDGASTLLPTNGQPMSLLEIVEHEAMGYQAWRTAAGNFLSGQLARVAQLLRWTGASTPDEHEDRMETYDRELRDRYFDKGYQEGFEAGLREAERGRRAID